MGVPILMAKSDLKKVAPLWLEYSKRFRLDPAVGLSPQYLPFSRHLFSKVAARLVMRQLCWLAAAAVGQKEYFMLKVSLAAQTFNGNLTGDDFTKTPGDKSWMSEMCVCPLGMLSYA